MLGTLRYVLALLVAASHIDIKVAGMNPGVVAVVAFYLISGYVMTGLIHKHYANPTAIGRFYLDRALRLLPHYYVIVGITLIWFLVTGFRNFYLSREPAIGNILENLAIVPLNYFMFNDALRFGLVPPAWSLGAEIQFYLVLPLIFYAGIRRLAMVASIVVYALAVFGLLNPDWFGYRLLPGVLFMFLTGSLLYDIQHFSNANARAFRLILVSCVSAALLAGILALTRNLSVAVNRETILGIFLGVPLLSLLGIRQSTRWDEFLGNLSYGVFLNHFFVKWAVFGDNVSGPASVALYLLLSTALAIVMHHVIERPVLALRRSLRRPSDGNLPGSAEASCQRPV